MKNKIDMTVLKKKIQVSFWVFISLAVLLVIFSVQNSGPIEVKILFWRVEISLAILLIGTFLTGLITGALYAYKKFLPEPVEIEDKPNDNFFKELKKNNYDIEEDI